MTILLVSLFFLSGPADELLAKLAPVLASPPATGLLVFEVTPGSQAERAGIRVGDILTHFDGQPVARHQDLIEIAREAARAQKSELVLLLQRGDEQIEAIVQPGSLGIRLEDVTQGEKRTLTPQTTRSTKPLDMSYLASEIARGSHRYWLVDMGDPQAPIGWSHHYLVRDAQSNNTLRIHQVLKIDESTILRQDIVVRFELDSYLTPTAMTVRTNDLSILDVARDGEEWVGIRTSVPARMPAEARTMSAYLLPYLAESLARSAGQDLWMQYLPPASLQAAPLSRLARSSNNDETVELWKFGRREAACNLAEYQTKSLTYREGMRMISVQEADILPFFPEWKKEFDPIERVPSAAVPRSQRAN